MKHNKPIILFIFSTKITAHRHSALHWMVIVMVRFACLGQPEVSASWVMQTHWERYYKIKESEKDWAMIGFMSRDNRGGVDKGEKLYLEKDGAIITDAILLRDRVREGGYRRVQELGARIFTDTMVYGTRRWAAGLALPRHSPTTGSAVPYDFTNGC